MACRNIEIARYRRIRFVVSRCTVHKSLCLPLPRLTPSRYKATYLPHPLRRHSVAIQHLIIFARPPNDFVFDRCHFYTWQFVGCLSTPKYGQRRGPLSFCQLHKRAGMHTNRNGQLLVATRDGSGETMAAVLVDVALQSLDAALDVSGWVLYWSVSIAPDGSWKNSQSKQTLQSRLRV